MNGGLALGGATVTRMPASGASRRSGREARSATRAACQGRKGFLSTRPAKTVQDAGISVAFVRCVPAWHGHCGPGKRSVSHSTIREDQRRGQPARRGHVAPAQMLVGLNGYVTNIPVDTLDARSPPSPRITTCGTSSSPSGCPRQTSQPAQCSSAHETPSKPTSPLTSPRLPSPAMSNAAPASAFATSADSFAPCDQQPSPSTVLPRPSHPPSPPTSTPSSTPSPAATNPRTNEMS